jgi:hypothetical protein
MNQEEFDKVIRGAMPPVTITDERLDHFIDAVLDQAATGPGQGAAGRFFMAWRWPTLAPALRFAVPMAVAVILGILLGGRYEEDWPVAQFSSLYLSTMLVPMGS